MRHLCSAASLMLVIFGLAACGGGTAQAPTPSVQTGESQIPSQASAVTASAALSSSFNRAGNILIADQFNNRIIEIDPATHKVIWQFGSVPGFTPGPHSVVGPNDSQRVGPFTLIAGTGVPAAPPLLEPNCAAGCPDNRVILVSPRGNILWQYGADGGVSGSGPDQLNTPVQATFLPTFHVLITDQANERVIEVTGSKRIVWQYGSTGTSGNGPDQLSNPNSAELLANGHILIADENNNRVIEVTRGHQIVWQYPQTPDPAKLNGAAFASRLDNGDTLITDSNNNRVIEVDRNGALVWTYSTLDPAGNSAPLPTRAVRLRNGNTLISDQFNDRVIEVQRTSPTSGNIVFTQGKLNVIGADFDELNGPYDAKVNGDYTGLTPPFFFPSFQRSVVEPSAETESSPMRD
jgi:outer membrane protein assembly factor BamB